MKVVLEVKRHNPDKEKAPRYEKYPVEVEPTDRVLDALISVARNDDGSLVFRRSCAHGVCGSDAMRINGREGLACKTLIRDAITGTHWEKKTGDKAEEVSGSPSDPPTIRIEPLDHLGVQRDLMVDQTAFFSKFRSVKPYLIPKKEPEGKEYFQSQEEREAFDDATKCINCGACYSVCPVLDENPSFLGPAAIVQAARFVFDSRDKGLEPRLDVLDTPNGIWPCENHFECTRVCPRGIKITKLINQTKRAVTKYRTDRGEKTAEPGSAK